MRPIATLLAFAAGLLATTTGLVGAEPGYRQTIAARRHANYHAHLHYRLPS